MIRRTCGRGWLGGLTPPRSGACIHCQGKHDADVVAFELGGDVEAVDGLEEFVQPRKPPLGDFGIDVIAEVPHKFQAVKLEPFADPRDVDEQHFPPAVRGGRPRVAEGRIGGEPRLPLLPQKGFGGFGRTGQDQVRRREGERRLPGRQPLQPRDGQFAGFAERTTAWKSGSRRRCGGGRPNVQSRPQSVVQALGQRRPCLLLVRRREPRGQQEVQGAPFRETVLGLLTTYPQSSWPRLGSTDCTGS